MSDIVFILLITENGNGYDDPLNQKIVFIAHNEKLKTDIKSILYLLNRKNTRGVNNLNLNIIEHDLMIMNIDYLGKYNDLIDYNQTKIFSMDAISEEELSRYMMKFYLLMQKDTHIKQILYSRRKKYVPGNKKMYFFLIKIFICNSCTDKFILDNIFNVETIDIKKVKIKVNNIEMDKNNKTEQGIKKNNWKNFN